ncbi:MAG TPA: hypothetical protein VKK31_13055 [Thermoanaerobaculia bacterium]|nr:hypothetical protein [Thermoanaerobaculia bacterium]
MTDRVLLKGGGAGRGVWEGLGAAFACTAMGRVRLGRGGGCRR